MNRFLLAFVMLFNLSCNDSTFNSEARTSTRSDHTKSSLPAVDTESEASEIPVVTEQESVDLEAKKDLSDELIPQSKLPQFGLIINRPQCSFCHLEVNGDVASTEDIKSSDVMSQSLVHINGSWISAKSIHAAVQKKVSTVDGIQENVSLSGNPAIAPPVFPRFENEYIRERAKGEFKSTDQSVIGFHSGNLVLDGKSHPITLSGDVLVDGDVVITGKYKGQGNLYATGNIYIPFDLVASTSAFPFPKATAEAMESAKASMEKKHDSLGLAAKGAILIGDLGHNFQNWWHRKIYPMSWIYTHGGSNYDKKFNVERVYSWFPGGKQSYTQLYGKAWDCVNDVPDAVLGSINRIDAMLYSPEMVGGVVRRNVYAINGGVIAERLHIVSRQGQGSYVFSGRSSPKCKGTVNPVTGLDTAKNRINYDYRIRHGLNVLGLLKQD